MNTRLSLLFFILFFCACTDLREMDLLDDPNSIKPDQTDIDLLNNSIQLSFKDFQYELHLIADGIVRYTTLNAFSYSDALRAEVGDKVWEIAYSELLPDMELLISLASQKNLNIYEGRVKILKAYVLNTLVDFFGNVPEVDLKPDFTFSPELIEGSLIYQHSDQLLSEAIDLLSEEGIKPINDLYYNGNNDHWIKLAWTLKLKNAIYTSKIRDNSNLISDIVKNRDIIDTNDESFVFRYGKERDDPPSRNPLYETYYVNGSGEYLGNYFMWTLTQEKRTQYGTPLGDPRSRLYLYKQSSSLKALEKKGISCYTVTYSQDIMLPSHYADIDPDLPFCVASKFGHYGRDHGNGLPDFNDFEFRTVYGLYPIGGRWDGQYLDKLNELDEPGAKGQGILPIIRASSVDFMRAEAAYSIGSGESARELIGNGIRKSIDEALKFTELDPTIFTDIVIDPIGPAFPRWEAFGVSEYQIERYIEYVLDKYDTATDKLDVIMKEAYIARWGNAVETYNAYRRTGKPNNMQPGLDPDLIGPFPKSLLRPSVHVNRNANVTQKSLQDLVFWDPGGIICR